MSSTLHAVLTADERYERRARRLGRPAARRQGTRRSVVLAHLAEVA